MQLVQKALGVLHPRTPPTVSSPIFGPGPQLYSLAPSNRRIQRVSKLISWKMASWQALYKTPGLQRMNCHRQAPCCISSSTNHHRPYRITQPHHGHQVLDNAPPSRSASCGVLRPDTSSDDSGSGTTAAAKFAYDDAPALRVVVSDSPSCCGARGFHGGYQLARLSQYRGRLCHRI